MSRHPPRPPRHSNHQSGVTLPHRVQHALDITPPELAAMPLITSALETATAIEPHGMSYMVLVRWAGSCTMTLHVDRATKRPATAVTCATSRQERRAQIQMVRAGFAHAVAPILNPFPPPGVQENGTDQGRLRKRPPPPFDCCPANTFLVRASRFSNRATLRAPTL